MLYKDIEILKKEISNNELIDISEYDLKDKDVFLFLENNLKTEEIINIIKFYEENNFKNIRNVFSKEIQSQYLIYLLKKFYKDNKKYPLSLQDFKIFDNITSKNIKNYDNIQNFYNNFKNNELKQLIPIFKNKNNFLLQLIEKDYLVTTKNKAPFFNISIEKQYLFKKIEDFYKINKRYPIYFDEFLDKENNLPTTYNQQPINNLNIILDIYKEMFNFNQKDIEMFLIKENIKLFSISSTRKIFKYKDILNKDDIRNKIFYSSFYMFNHLNNHFPSYKELKKSDLFPFISGIEKKEDLLFENLEFNEEIKTIINEDFCIKLNEELNNMNTNIDENLKISLQIEYFIYEVINNILENKDKKDFIFNLEDFKEEYNVFLNNYTFKEKEIMFNDINNILEIIKEYKEDFKDIEIINANEIKANCKGFDYLINNKITKEEIYISYKWKVGRSNANLTFNKYFPEINSDELLENKNLINLLKDIEEVIFNYDTIISLIKEKIEFVLDYVEENFDSSVDIKEYLFKKLNEEKILDNYKLDGFSFDNGFYIINDLEEREKFNKNIDKMITLDIYKLFSKNHIDFDLLFKDKEKIKNNLIFNISKQSFLKHSLFNTEDDKNRLFYKNIIKNIYRNPDVLEIVSEELNLENTFDIEIYKYYQIYFKEKLKEKLETLKGDELINVINYILHLDSVNNNSDSKFFIVENGGTKLIPNSNLFEFIKEDIKFKAINFIESSNGVNFDLKLIYKNKEVLFSFTDNIIKSKEGKFIGGDLIDFSSGNKFYLNKELISSINQNIQLNKSKEINLDSKKQDYNVNNLSI